MLLPIECGIDVFLKYHRPSKTPVNYGLVTNSACIDQSGMTITNMLIQAKVTIKKIFSPEHGYEARGEDGVYQPGALLNDHVIPIISLYSNQMKPTAPDLAGLDAMLIDLPNVGSRFYTYLWTMDLVLEACNSYRVPVVILDRPNPLSGAIHSSEGPILSEEFFSFIGQWHLPIRFGLTLGELALLLKKEKQYHSLDIKVIQVEGWNRSMNIFQYHYPFVPPSPAISQATTIWTYPAICFLEATNVSEGRGTSFSFQVALAPWITSTLLIRHLDKLELSGVKFESISIIPSENKYKGTVCQGVHLMITDVIAYRPVRCGILLLATLKTLFPDHFQWQPYPTLANPEGTHHFERLTGDIRLLQWLEDAPLDHISELDHLLDPKDWSERCASILLYD